MQLLLKRLFLLILAFSFPSALFPQIIKGRITDTKNIPVAFAVIYDETSLTGTTSNTDGYYEMKLEPGNHTLLFKAMGYFQVKEDIRIDGSSVTKNIQLKEQPVQLKEVIIRPGREDPAYAIMRKVIARAPYHQSRVKKYIADVYLRGTAHIVKMPKFISKRMEVDGETAVFKTGDIYMEESVNQVTFQAPDNYEQKVISIKSNFPWNNEEINPMGLINSSLYQPEIEEFISPLAPNAFQFYNYKYEGFIEESDKVIFIISVSPKRNSQQLMRGSIYIVDQIWCLHSADVSINMFFGSLNYKIIYSPVKSDAWLPVSYQFYVDASILGIKANFKYASSVKFSEVILNEKSLHLQAVQEKTYPSDAPEEKKTKNQKEIEELLSKEDLTNRDMIRIASKMAKETKGDTVKDKSLEIKDEDVNNTKVVVDENAVRNDSIYWNKVRPIPLSSIESKIQPRAELKPDPVRDSVIVDVDSKDKSGNGLRKFYGFITGGAGLRLFDSTLHVRYNGLIGFNKFDFNTVDGFIFRQTIGIEHHIDSAGSLKLEPGAAWAFSRERLMWWTNVNYDYAPLRGGNLRFYIGSVSADYNGESGINSNLNTLASLVFRRNYMKVYQQNLAYFENKIDLANGLNLSVQAGYRTAMPLQNQSDFSFFYRNEREYTPNLPGNRSDVAERNVYNEESYYDIRLEFTPRYYYKIYGGKKHYQHSAWPTLFIRNRSAIPGIVNSTADYSYLETGIRYQKSWAMMHEFSLSIQGGFFLNRNRIFAMDDKYLNNNDLPVIFSNAKGAFRLLPFYRYAITDKYGEAHIQYTTPYLFFKYLPFLSNKLWVESLHINYLAGGAGLHYWEAGYSMGQIYMIANVGVFAGFNEDQFRSWGLQVSFNF